MPEKKTTEMLGFCSACGVKVMDLKREGNKATLKKLPNYKEHFVELNNNTIMKVAVCDDCKVELVSGNAKRKAKEIIANHKSYWDNLKERKKKYFKGYEKLEVVNPNTDLRTFIKKRKEKEEITITIKK